MIHVSEIINFLFPKKFMKFQIFSKIIDSSRNQWSIIIVNNFSSHAIIFNRNVMFSRAWGVCSQRMQIRGGMEIEPRAAYLIASLLMTGIETNRFVQVILSRRAVQTSVVPVENIPDLESSRLLNKKKKTRYCV